MCQQVGDDENSVFHERETSRDRRGDGPRRGIKTEARIASEGRATIFPRSRFGLFERGLVNYRVSQNERDHPKCDAWDDSCAAGVALPSPVPPHRSPRRLKKEGMEPKPTKA